MYKGYWRTVLSNIWLTEAEGERTTTTCTCSVAFTKDTWQSDVPVTNSNTGCLCLHSDLYTKTSCIHQALSEHSGSNLSKAAKLDQQRPIWSGLIFSGNCFHFPLVIVVWACSVLTAVVWCSVMTNNLVIALDIFQTGVTSAWTVEGSESGSWKPVTVTGQILPPVDLYYY